MNRRPVPVLFLDLDGTVRHGLSELGCFVNGPEDVVVFPEAVERMGVWKANGGRIVGITNQGGVALGYLSFADCCDALRRTEELTGHLFDTIRMCIDHPKSTAPTTAWCWCRKPSPGLVFDAINVLSEAHPDEFYPPHLALMVGDWAVDQECAQRAGIKFMWADEWRGTKGN